MVVHDRTPSAKDPCDHICGTRVERERAEILHDDQVGAGERPLDLVFRRGLGGTHRQTR